MSNNRIQTPASISTAGSRQEGETRQEDRQQAVQEAVQPLFGAAQAQGLPQPALTGTGFTYRHDWGARRGQWVLRLNWGDVGPGSQVFVSIAEGVAPGPDAGKFIGAARYSVYNVAPRAGGVDIWVNVEWDANISTLPRTLLPRSGSCATGRSSCCRRTYRLPSRPPPT